MNILKDSFRDSIKYILTRVFVLVIVGFVFLAIFYFIGKKYENKYTFVENINELVFGYKVHALTYSEFDVWTSNTPATFTGTLTNQTDVLKTNFGSPIPKDGHDYLVLKFGIFKLKYNDNISISMQNTYCNTYGYYDLTRVCPNGDCSSPLAYRQIQCKSTSTSGTNSSTLSTGNIYMQLRLFYGNNFSPCFMTDELKDLVICPMNHNYGDATGFEIQIMQGGYKSVEYTINLNGTKYYYESDNKDIIDGLNNLKNIQQQQQQFIQDSTTTSSSNTFNTFINNYTNTIPNNITRVVATPLQTIVNLQSTTCTPLSLTIPFLNQTFTLPCMDAIYTQYFGGFYTIYQVIVSGLVTYWCIIGILNTVKSLLDADDDKIEVLDL